MMHALFNQLLTTGVATGYAWDGLGADAGTTVNGLEDVLNLTTETGTRIAYARGDFTQTNGPKLSATDAITLHPFGSELFGECYFYVLKMERDKSFNGVFDKLTYDIFRRNTNRNSPVEFFEFGSADDTRNFLRLEFQRNRIHSFDAGTSGIDGTAAWTKFERTGLYNKAFQSFAMNSKYLFDPRIGDTWHIDNYNPALPLSLPESFFNGFRTTCVISYSNAAVNGVPSFGTKLNSLFTLSAASAPITVGSNGRILVDMTNPNAFLVTVVES